VLDVFNLNNKFPERNVSET